MKNLKLHFLGLPGAGKSTISTLLFSYLKLHLPLDIEYHNEQVKVGINMGVITKELLESPTYREKMTHAHVNIINNCKADILVSENSPLQNLFFQFVSDGISALSHPYFSTLTRKDIIFFVGKDMEEFHVNKGRIHTKSDCDKIEPVYAEYTEFLDERCSTFFVTKGSIHVMLPGITRELLSMYLSE